jgi:hypothetical protein
MLKTFGAALTLALVAATAGQALALNPQPLPPRQRPHYAVSHVVVPHCPPAKGYAKTCF